ncbi:hypothetical protein G6F42_016530 [Rhizopus arrhizus]|nr:hypothetical protein G6F42_016530 [Rhizopus arrhizus]
MDDTFVGVVLRYTLKTAKLEPKWYHTYIASFASFVMARCAIITANATCATCAAATMATGTTAHAMLFIIN